MIRHNDAFIEQSIEQLRKERQSYVERLCALACETNRDTQSEMNGYLRCISNVNTALVNLARSASDYTTPCTPEYRTNELLQAA